MRSSVRWLFAGLVTVHGLIHLLGVVEGFGFADVQQLTQPVTPGAAVLWLIAAVAVLASVPFTLLRSRGWWWLTAAAALVSQVAILTSWGDAKAGTAANVIMVLAAGYGYRANSRRQQ
jgi:hypothetical protein